MSSAGWHPAFQAQDAAQYVILQIVFCDFREMIYQFQWLPKAVLFRKRFQAYQRGSIAEAYKTARSRDSPAIYALHPILGLIIYGSTAQWERRASEDLLPQSCSMKNGKYTKYSCIFHTFAWVKISRRISLPHYAVLPYDLSEYASPTAALCGLEVLQTFSTLLNEEILYNSCKNCMLMVY